MAQNHATQKERVLRVLEQANSPIESEKVYDRLDRIPADTISGVRGTLSVLNDEGRVELTGDSPPYRYRATGATQENVQENVEEFESDESNGETGLAVLFDSVDEGDGPGTDDGSLEPGVPEEVQDDLERVEDRVQDLERRLSATGDGGGAATLSLPVADRDAPLDHATVVYELGSRRKVRDYLRALLGLPEETTDSEQRADEEEAVEVVEKE